MFSWLLGGQVGAEFQPNLVNFNFSVCFMRLNIEMYTVPQCQVVQSGRQVFSAGILLCTAQSSPIVVKNFTIHSDEWAENQQESSDQTET